MELMQLYNQIKNPIDDPKVIEKLILVYANRSKGMGGFYNKLTSTVQKQYRGQYYRTDGDAFYAMLFNKWKNSIISMTKEEFLELYKRGSYDKDFIKLRKYLLDVPDVSTMQEANNIFFADRDDKELMEAFDKYRWSRFGEGSGWVHVSSRYLTAKKDPHFEVEHRLYIDTESIDTYKLTKLLVEKCDKYHIPYYFKFDQIGDRDDTIVIYSSTENLTKYVEILQEIKKEYPDLISRIKEPPLLTGKIDNWIGYGSEPSTTPDGKNYSFNEIRSSAIESAIDKCTKKWIMDHRYIQATYKGEKMIFQDFIAMKATEKFISKLEEKYLRFEKSYKEIANSRGEQYNQFIVIDQMGYSLQDIRSSQFKQNIYNTIKNHMNNILPIVCNKGNAMNSIVMNVRNGKQISFNRYDLEIILEEISPSIARNDKDFVLEVKSQIIENAKKYGIDTEKFCFDVNAREKMKSYSQTMNNKNENTNDQIDLSSLYVSNFTNLISPTLMKKEMKIPTGKKVSAKDYLQRVVYPQLPSNGVVILKNGAVVSIKQFIEEKVMFECQEKYNGDFLKFMAEQTKNNLGVISINSGKETIDFYPGEITEYISSDLLNRKIKLANGNEIPAKQYIEEVYAPHIPSSGMVTLSNGSVISVKQYIEEVLLEQIDKYKGDISKLLYLTTRNNNGTINCDPRHTQEVFLEMKNIVDKSKQQSSGISI